MKKEDKYLPKRPRIKDFPYKGVFAYFITICADSKRKPFVAPDVVDLVIKYLKSTSNEHDFQIYSYCFMPDHLHLLIIANKENASLKDFIKLFKQKSGFYYKQRYGNKLWQPSYYDHVLRKNEDLNQIADYIFCNPVRKGFVNDFRKYPYLGSFMFDL